MHHRSRPSLRTILAGVGILTALGLAKLAVPAAGWTVVDTTAHVGIIAGLGIVASWFAIGLRQAADDRTRLMARLDQLAEGQSDLRRRDDLAAAERRDLAAQVTAATDGLRAAVDTLAGRVAGAEQVLLQFVRELGSMHAARAAQDQFEAHLLDEVRANGAILKDIVGGAALDTYYRAYLAGVRQRNDGD